MKSGAIPGFILLAVFLFVSLGFVGYTDATSPYNDRLAWDKACIHATSVWRWDSTHTTLVTLQAYGASEIQNLQTGYIMCDNGLKLKVHKGFGTSGFAPQGYAVRQSQ